MAKTKTEEKRIYCIVPETVSIPAPRGGRARTVRMESGRLAMQALHAGLHMYEDVLRRNRKAAGYGNITAILLSVPNSRALADIEARLRALAASYGIPPFGVYSFADSNPDVYRTRRRIPTAICTTPVRQSVVDPVLGPLEPYRDPLERLRELMRP